MGVNITYKDRNYNDDFFPNLNVFSIKDGWVQLYEWEHSKRAFAIISSDTVKKVSLKYQDVAPSNLKVVDG